MDARSDGLPIHTFPTQQAFRDRLEANHAIAPGLWLRFYKKASGLPTVVWAEAVEVALSFGWIDAVVNRLDDLSYLQRFVPRRPRSLWSKKNVATVERLIAEGRMRPAGLAQVERARADGRLSAAYDGPREMQLPQDFLAALSGFPRARAHFETLNKSALYAIAFRLHTAKRADTRARRLQQFLAKLEAGESIP